MSTRHLPRGLAHWLWLAAELLVIAIALAFGALSAAAFL